MGVCGLPLFASVSHGGRFVRVCLVLLFDTIHSGFGVSVSSQIEAATSKHMIKSHNGHGSRVSSAKRRPTYRARSVRVLKRLGRGVAFGNLDLWEVLHGRILGFGRMAEVLVVLPVLGGERQSQHGGRGLGRTRSWLICLAFVLFRCIMARWRRPGGVCLPVLFFSFPFGLGTLVFFFGVASLVAAVAHGSWFLKLFQGIFSWFGFGKASGIGSGRV